MQKSIYEHKIIRIISVNDPYRSGDYAGRTGEVTHVDDIGQLHGTWGGCALIPGVDQFRVIGENCINHCGKTI